MKTSLARRQQCLTRSRRLLALVLAVVATLCGPGRPGLADAGPPRRPAAGPLVTIHAPHRQHLELALDEIELEYGADKSGAVSAPAASAIEIGGTHLDLADGRRAIFSVSGVSDLEGLQRRVTELTAANPNGAAALVSYVPGQPKSSATLRLITREIGLLLDPGQDVSAVVAGLAVGSPRPVPGAPSGYVVETSDPFKALELAEVLRQRPGVVSAYPLVRRLFFGR